MKTKTTYGIFGVVAFAAILSIALIANGLGTQTADAVAANKFAFAEDGTAVSVSWSQGQDTQSSSVTIGPVVVKSSDKNNWHIGFTGECKNFSEVKAKGKKGDNDLLSGAVSGATATLIVDKDTDNETSYHSWLLCENDLRIEANLNALIEFVPGLNCDEVAVPGCGSLQFVCDFEDPDADPAVLASELCQQWVAVSSAVSGAYHTEWVVETLKAGDHTFEVLIEMTADASGDDTDTDLLSEPNGVESIVTITQKILTADTVHIANPNSIADPNS